jgi:HK97 family phage major capsid protein
VFAEMGLGTAKVVTETQLEGVREREAFRSFLAKGAELRTYSGMNVATDSQGGFLVPAGYFRDKVFSMLKATDRLFDEDVVTKYESENGNTLAVPMIDDTGTSATVIAEGVVSTEGEITTVDRVLLAKVPTWRSKQIIFSTELLQDSAFPAEDLIASAIATRFRRGIGASNVTTLLSAATSGLTSGSGTAVSLTDLLGLMGSLDPAYLASPKCFWAMRFSTLITLYQLRDSAGRNLIKPRRDANGNPLILDIPVAICPSMPAIAVNAKAVALGDFSRFFVRTVKNTLSLKRYSQSPGLAENGLVAFEGFVRSNAGLLVASGADSPVKYLTQAAV